MTRLVETTSTRAICESRTVSIQQWVSYAPHVSSHERFRCFSTVCSHVIVFAFHQFTQRTVKMRNQYKFFRTSLLLTSRIFAEIVPGVGYQHRLMKQTLPAGNDSHIFLCPEKCFGNRVQTSRTLSTCKSKLSHCICSTLNIPV